MKASLRDPESLKEAFTDFAALAPAGVSDVDADIATGEVTVVSEGPVDAQLVRSAVEEAGYEVVG